MGYRKKTIERAKQLASEGFSPKQIADKLSKDEDAQINYGNIIRSPDERTVRYWLKKERNIQQYPLTEEMREHDSKVFNKSDEILNEDRLDELLNSLYIGGRYHYDEAVMLYKYLNYFKKESNKYVAYNLQDQCHRCCKIIGRLSHFIKIHSAIVSDMEYDLGNRYKLVPGGSFDRFYNDLTNDDTRMPTENRFIEKSNKLVDECRIAYKEYRSAVRETLYL